MFNCALTQSTVRQKLVSLLFKETECSSFLQFFLGFDGEVGELLVHRRIMNLLQSKYISHDLLW